MTIEYRQVAEEEFASWRIAVRRGFNQHVHPDDIARLRKDRVEIDRIFGAFENDDLVGTGGADSYTLTLPGGNKIPTAGIAYIGTAATHLRRGILTGMMRTLLAQAVERKEPVATLWASQAGIYSRFGFGQATATENWSINTANSAFAHGPEIPGHTRLVSHEDALKIMPLVWERARQNRAGYVDRSPSRWRYFFFDEERIREGWSGLFHVIYEHDGDVEGYAAYRMKRLQQEEFALDMKVVEAITTTPSAQAAIWRFLLDVDLVKSLVAENQPTTDALWWMLANPRELKRQPTDGLWARILDVETALQAREYSTDGDIAIDVQDDFVPGAAGVFELTVTGSKSTCNRSTRQPDISLSQSELSAAYLGGTKLAALARAGRVTEQTPGAISRFDRMFTTAEPPWCPHEF